MANLAVARLVACDDLDSYVQVARCFDARTARQVPILGRSGPESSLESLAGFPRGIERIPHATWTAGSPTVEWPEVANDRWCVALDHPVCLALARFLADATGRRLLVFDAESWEASLDERLASEPVASLAFVVPLWTGDDVLDSHWLGRVLALVRARHARLAHVAWGIVTGVDPSALSRVVAKAILQPEIIASYADAPAGMYVSGSAASLGTALAPMGPRANEGPQAPLQFIDEDHVRAGTSVEVGQRPWSLLFFRGHGRSYCVCEGHLCGARPLATSPTLPALRCVQGMTCANPSDDFYRPGMRAFPRIDPRCYDTPLLLIDSCQSGGWSSSDWAAGTPPVAVHAASGAPSAVMSSDYATMSTGAAHTEVFQVLWSAPTIGEAIARLNRARPSAVAEFPYYLLGDPECPVGRSRWSGWCSEPLAERRQRSPECQTIVAVLPTTTPFARIALGLRGAEHTTSYVHTDDPDASIRAVHLLVDEQPELWLAIDRRTGSEPVVVVIETYPTPRLPKGLLDAALAVPLFIRSWSPELREGAGPLVQAAERIETVQDLVTQMRGRAVPIDASEPQASVALARKAWLEAQLALVEHALTNFSEGGLWSYRLWRGTDHRGTSSDLACPHCGISPTLQRRYHSPPALQRVQWECVACALISDRPLLPMPELAIEMPTQIATGQTIVAELAFESRESDPHFAIAGALLLDRKGHGVAVPSPFMFELPPGGRHALSVELSSTRPPDIHHRYYARALLLINGVWLVTTRLVTVGP